MRPPGTPALDEKNRPTPVGEKEGSRARKKSQRKRKGRKRKGKVRGNESVEEAPASKRGRLLAQQVCTSALTTSRREWVPPPGPGISGSVLLEERFPFKMIEGSPDLRR